MESKSNKEKSLFVFDFDYTLVDDNTDTFILDLCPQLELKKKLPALRKEHSCWTNLMDYFFSLLHREGCTRADVERHLRRVPLHEEALKSVRLLHASDSADAIILSDSNTVFIDLILNECDISDAFQVVLTNPAHFEADGRLRVEHLCVHSCQVCKSTPNICKSKVLREYRGAHDPYSRVVYVGDGQGDFCPAISLSEGDVVICREGYRLAEKLSSSPCRAEVIEVDFVKGLSEAVKRSL